MKQFFKLIFLLCLTFSPFSVNAQTDDAKWINEENARKKAEEEALLKEKRFTLPEDKGWSIIRTDKVNKDLECIHYDSGYRMYKKSNGSYIIFSEPKDARDPKTYDLKKGIDQQLADDVKAVLGYNLIFPSGASIHYDGENYCIELLDGSRIYPDKIDLNYGSFTKMDNLPLEEFVNTDYSRNDKSMVYVPGESGTKVDGLYVRYLIIETNERNFGQNILFDNNGIVYQLTDQKLKPYGIYKDDLLFESMGEIESINNGTIKFSNGDYFNFFSPSDLTGDYRIHLKDGRIFEAAPDADRIKISFPNGDRYVGLLMTPYAHSLYSDGNYVLFDPKFTLYFFDGIYTDSKGKEYQYYHGRSEREIALEKTTQAQTMAKYYNKYGKSQVDILLNKGLAVGLNFKMVQELWPYPIGYDSESSSGTWYKVIVDIGNNFKTTTRWIHVSKATGKITYVGSNHTYKPF